MTEMALAFSASCISPISASNPNVLVELAVIDVDVVELEAADSTMPAPPLTVVINELVAVVVVVVVAAVDEEGICAAVDALVVVVLATMLLLFA